MRAASILTSLGLICAAGVVAGGASELADRIELHQGAAADLAWYYGPVVAVVVILAAACRLPLPARFAALLTTIAGGLAVLGVEAVLAFAPDEPPPADDARTELAALRQAADDDGVMANPPPAALLRPDGRGGLASRIRIDGEEALPGGGIANAPVMFCERPGAFAVRTLDERGFNNPAGLWAGPVEVAVLGDSYTYGLCVPREENIVAHIARRIPATLNLGRNGNGPLIMLATLKEYLPAVRPRAVVWVFAERNDLVKDLGAERRSALLMRYLEPDFRLGLASKQAAVDRALTEAAAALEAEADGPAAPAAPRSVSLRDLVLLRNLRHAFGWAAGATAADKALFRDVLREAKRTVESWDGKLYFVYLAARESLATPSLPRRLARERTIDLAAGLGLPVVDLYEVFATAPNLESLFLPDGHYNAAGARRAGAAIAAALAEGTE